METRVTLKEQIDAALTLYLGRHATLIEISKCAMMIGMIDLNCASDLLMALNS